MTKFLDLRKRVQPQVEIIYKTIVEPQPWYMELAKITVSVVVVGLVVLGVSKADFDQSAVAEVTPPSPVGVFGTVDALNSSTLLLVNAQGSEFTGHTSFTVNLTHLQKVETSNYDPRTLADIQSGDSIIAHGILTDSTIDADSIITFSDRAPVEATSTLDVATSTDPLSSTTPDVASSTATSTDSATSTSETIIEKIGDIVQDVVDFFTGTSTPDDSTTTPDIASTTPEVTATTTPDTSPQDSVPPTATDTPATDTSTSTP